MKALGLSLTDLGVRSVCVFRGKGHLVFEVFSDFIFGMCNFLSGLSSFVSGERQRIYTCPGLMDDTLALLNDINPIHIGNV